MTLPGWLDRGPSGRIRVKRVDEPGNADEVAKGAVVRSARAIARLRGWLPVEYIIVGGAAALVADQLHEHQVALILNTEWTLPLVGSLILVAGVALGQLVRYL